MQVKVFVAEEIHEGIVRGGARARRWEEHMNEWLSQHPQARDVCAPIGYRDPNEAMDDLRLVRGGRGLGVAFGLLDRRFDPCAHARAHELKMEAPRGAGVEVHDLGRPNRERPVHR